LAKIRINQGLLYTPKHGVMTDVNHSDWQTLLCTKSCSWLLVC